MARHPHTPRHRRRRRRAVIDGRRGPRQRPQAGHRVVIAVVDPCGELVRLRRTDGAQIASSRVAVDKARTAAIFVRPSREIEEQVTAGRLGALALHGAAALTGGIPLTVDGEVVGAVGTSGETPDEDEAVSIAGAAAGFSTVEVAGAHATTARGSRPRPPAPTPRARGVAPVVAVVDAGGELVYLLAARRRAGRERRRRHRQGAHGRDLPPAEQGLRGAGVERPRRPRCTSRAPCRSRAACPIVARRPRSSARSASAAPPRPTRTRSSRSSAPRRPTAAAAPSNGHARAAAAFFSRDALQHDLRARRPAARQPAATRSTPAGASAGRGRVPRARHRRHARRRGLGHRGHRRRHGRRREVGPGELRAHAIAGGSAAPAAAGDVLAIPNGVAAPVHRRLRSVPVPRREGRGLRWPPSSTSTSAARVPGPPELLPGRPDAVVDLQTDAGAALVGGARGATRRARCEEIDFVARRPVRPLGPERVPEPHLRRRCRTPRRPTSTTPAGGVLAPARRRCSRLGRRARLLQLVPASTVTIPERHRRPRPDRRDRRVRGRRRRLRRGVGRRRAAARARRDRRRRSWPASTRPTASC